MGLWDIAALCLYDIWQNDCTYFRDVLRHTIIVADNSNVGVVGTMIKNSGPGTKISQHICHPSNSAFTR